MNCTKIGPVFKRMECFYRQVDTNRYGISVHLSGNRQLSKNAEIGMAVHLKFQKTNKVVKFLEFKFNICDTLEKQNLPVPMFKSIFNEVMMKSNVPFSCPVIKDFIYNVTDFMLTDNIFPAYTVLANFNFTMTFYNDYKKFGTLVLTGRTYPKKS
ncbi:uncharacterized protein LOC109612915 [Musca domestica]|uniref:Uncharacterized protein LOC109612915 n=1 Tax=Musca domestica TaxID=7370 RepID=A0A9J7IE25_MUSDO|nr:uncharacterized protein LOC109612915 [Musca domestica]